MTAPANITGQGTPAAIAANWHTTPRIQGLLAGAPRYEFVQRPTITPDGRDPVEWHGDTDLALAFIERLRRARMSAVDAALGYNWEDYPDGDEHRLRWALVFLSAPSASDALTAEFRRRDGSRCDDFLTWPVVVDRMVA